MEHFCKECGHYLRHYILDEQACTAINCGHCTVPRIKNRKPDAPACAHFVPGERKLPDSKHFLTMELLRWFQGLEFPPEVRQDG
jgi:hypothetical protein